MTRIAFECVIILDFRIYFLIKKYIFFSFRKLFGRGPEMLNQHFLKYRKVLEDSKYCASWKKRLLFYYDKYIVPLSFYQFVGFLDNPDKFVDQFVNKYHVKITLLRTLYEMMLFLVKNVQELSTVNRVNKWTEYYTLISIMYDKYLDDRKKESIECLLKDGVTIDSLIEYRSKLEVHDPLRMLLNVYVLIPPARADYGAIRIYLNDDDFKKENMPNYIMLDMKDKKGKLCLRQYKTAGYYDKIENDVPIDMMNDLVVIMEKNPSKKYLFERYDGTQYNVKRYDEFANRNFRRIHKKLTINLIRKLYATYHGDSISEIVTKANALKHRLKTHVNYYMSLGNSKLYKKLTSKDDEESSDVEINENMK